MAGSSGSGAGGSPGGTGSGGVAGASEAGSTSAGKASGGAGSGVGGSASGAGGAAAGSAGKASAGTTAGGAAGSGAGGTAGTGACGAVVACLVHRYSFGGTGTTVTDSVSDAHGTVVNATVGGGQVTLTGGTSDQYVSLPPAIFSDLTSATFEVWLTWSGGSAWQRIFDFGTNDGAGAGRQGPNGTSYLFVTPRAVNNSGRLRVAFSLAGPTGETLIDASAALPTSGTSHVAVVVDDSAETLALYLNGASAGSSALTGSLSSLSIVNAWLGRSQFASDPEFAGAIQEFRVYAAARTSTQISASFSAGPDSTPAN